LPSLFLWILPAACGPASGLRQVVTGAKIFPPALTGADKGINPERAIWAAEDAIQ